MCFPYPLFFLLYRYSSGYQFNYLFDAKLQDIGWRTKLVFQENYGSCALRGMHNLTYIGTTSRIDNPGGHWTSL